MLFLVSERDEHMKSKQRSLLVQTHKTSWLKNWQLWVMVLPALAYLLVFNYLPMYGVQLAFRDFKFGAGIAGGDWVGLKYFKMYFSNPMFLPTLKNTFLISFSTIVFGFPMPIFLALILNQLRSQHFKKVVQTTVYLPYFISTVVLVSLINILLSPTTGLVDDLLKTIGIIPEGANLLGDTNYFIPVYVISGIWQSCGWNSIIFLAALSAVDTQLYDACKIDGANRWQIVWNIELPSIMPTIIILLIMNMGNILSVGFEKTFLMQNNLNKGVSEVISTYVFNVGLKSSQFSFGSAVGLFNTLINFMFLLIANSVSKKFSDVSLM